MKKLVLKTIEFFTGAKVHATHKAIKGRKSNGKEDATGYQHWKSMSGDTQ